MQSPKGLRRDLASQDQRPRFCQCRPGIFSLDFPSSSRPHWHMTTPDLRGVRILADMTNAQLGALLNYGEILQFDAGRVIVAQGDRADALFLLLEGKAGAYVTDPYGNETHLRTTEAGGHFGEIGVLEAGSRTATVKAVTPCTVFRLNARAFRDILKTPDLATPLLHGLSRSLAIRLADITARFAELRSLKDAWLV